MTIVHFAWLPQGNATGQLGSRPLDCVARNGGNEKRRRYVVAVQSISRSHGFGGERRLDVVELRECCWACGKAPACFFGQPVGGSRSPLRSSCGTPRSVRARPSRTSAARRRRKVVAVHNQRLEGASASDVRGTKLLFKRRRILLPSALRLSMVIDRPFDFLSASAALEVFLRAAVHGVSLRTIRRDRAVGAVRL